MINMQLFIGSGTLKSFTDYTLQTDYQIILIYHILYPKLILIIYMLYFTQQTSSRMSILLRLLTLKIQLI